MSKDVGLVNVAREGGMAWWVTQAEAKEILAARASIPSGSAKEPDPKDEAPEG